MVCIPVRYEQTVRVIPGHTLTGCPPPNGPALGNTNRNALMEFSQSPYPSHPLGLYAPNTVPSIDVATKL